MNGIFRVKMARFLWAFLGFLSAAKSIQFNHGNLNKCDKTVSLWGWVLGYHHQHLCFIFYLFMFA
jgi:hypothetical protein